MRLICKVPEGKPPFIGILYAGTREAHDHSKNLKEFVGKILKLRVDCNYGRVFLYLNDSNDNEVGYYRAVEYDAVEYKLWRAYTNKEINFAHCYMEGKELKVARSPEGKLFVLKISRFEHQL